MTEPSKASPAGVIVAIMLTAVAALLWAQTVALLADLSGGDAAGRGMAQGFAAIGIVLVWLLLGAIALLAYAKGEMPRWTAIAALLLIPASGGASMGTLDLLARPSLAPYYGPLVIPVLAPPLIVAFCYWALLPSLRRRIPDTVAGRAIWGAVLILCLAILPMQQIRERVLAVQEAARARYDAALAAVPPDAPLTTLAPFLATGDPVQVERVLARIRRLDRRQADAEEMLARGDFPLAFLGRFDLTPTPSLCDKARALLRKRATALTPASAEARRYIEIADEVDGAVAALQWLIDYDCPAMAEAEAWETMAKAYRDGNFSVYTLHELRDPKRLGRALYEDPAHASMLTPRAHLKAWLKFADDRKLRAQIIAGAATLDHRDADAVDILIEDGFTARVLMETIAQLDLKATPELCRFALDSLRAQFAAIWRPEPDDPRTYQELRGRLGRGEQFDALVWLASHGCAADGELAQAEALIKAYRPSPESAAMLERLQRARRP